MNVFIDPRFDDVYQRHPLVLVDVGARGGLKKNWSAAARHLRLLGFEPDSREFGRLADPDVEQGFSPARPARSGEPSNVFFDVALADKAGTIRLHVARDAGLSSVFEPNAQFLDAFPEAGRFDTVDIRDVPADTLDNLLRTRDVQDVDFIKADTQGSELLVLRGAAATLASAMFGVEVEVEFAEIYRGQPLFADVDPFLRGLGYQLFDLRPVYWKRAAGRRIGGPRGQMAWADALYLKSAPALKTALAPLSPDMRRSKVLRAMSICLLYGYQDYALELARSLGDVLTAEERDLAERRLRTGETAGALDNLPGRRIVAATLHRLWRLCVPRDDSWSISRAEIGNLD